MHIYTHQYICIYTHTLTHRLIDRYFEIKILKWKDNDFRIILESKYSFKSINKRNFAERGGPQELFTDVSDLKFIAMR